MSNEAATLVEAIRHFADPDVTLNTMVSLRWPNGVCCPTCGRDDVRFIKTRRMWECKAVQPKKQFSAKVGTIFKDTALCLSTSGLSRFGWSLIARTASVPMKCIAQSA